MSVVTDPYEILGVDPTATMDEAKRVYRKLAKELHPDALVGKSEKEIAAAEARFKAIGKARDQLGQFRDEEVYARQQRRWTRVKTSWTAAESGRGHSRSSSSTKEPSATKPKNPSEGAYAEYRSTQTNTNTAQGATQQPETEARTDSASAKDTSSRSPKRGSRDAVGRAWRDLYPKPDNYLNYITKKPIWKSRFRAEEQNNYSAITRAIMACSKNGYPENKPTIHAAYVASTIFPALVQQSKKSGFLPAAPGTLDVEITAMLAKAATTEKGVAPNSHRGDLEKEKGLAQIMIEMAGAYDIENKGNKTILMLAKTLPMTPEIATMTLQHCTHDCVPALVKQIRDRTESKGKNKQLSPEFVMQVYSSLSAINPEKAQAFAHQLTRSERKDFAKNLMLMQQNHTQHNAA
ncbi:MAG: J domain-containing protein [Thalassospira sp.]|jgi:curved DNA-binding protein CbpA|nr:J domain-containing protein [Thalassospira sp.]